ncbi:hypothetical protein [Nodularia sphaerocarpa]|uniref:hypothetical protein n=1 Tax=Nodularia sphaerocarpa TaxID=137816 RepID=UPI001EFB67CF|nr:hypothetical protein [Nodularia sphaerocarpa]MDB9373613.1 hypothetical protein [Nodularia sphaerocarpa CS-585]MDB9376247.1 hypothetical protein [Nodularia sphaerocarpa CS-585A2]ULP74401.1 hypothetical protein BDGGKGIB_04068 [Nodularia sphaerocarpa UHCC 0038]
MFRRLILAGLVVIIVWLGLLSKPVASQQIESRFNNLQADFNRVESRLSRVEYQLNQMGKIPSPRTSLTRPQSTDAERNLSPQEQKFERLATLVVELKQQVNKLDKRVSQIESR